MVTRERIEECCFNYERDGCKGQGCPCGCHPPTPSETYLDSIAESTDHCRWVVEHHTGRGEGRQRCTICETWWPCDLVSVAATAVLLADRITADLEGG